MINGKVYVPKGFEQNKPNFEVLVDPSFNEGSFLVKIFSKNGTERLDFSIGSDSIRGVGIYHIFQSSRTKFVISVNGTSSNPTCTIFSNDEPSSQGYLNITKFDLVNSIFSGEFECEVVNSTCGFGNPIRITKGRFDKKL